MGQHNSKTWNGTQLDHHWIQCKLSQPCLFTQLSQCKKRFWSLMSLHISCFFYICWWDLEHQWRSQTGWLFLLWLDFDLNPVQLSPTAWWTRVCVALCVWLYFISIQHDYCDCWSSVCVCNKTLLLTLPRKNQLLIRIMKLAEGFCTTSSLCFVMGM